MPAEAHEHLPLTPLTMAILLALAEGDRHGYGLMKDVEEQTGGTLTPGTGSLYAALDRLMEEGLIRESPDEPVDSRRRRSYRLTPEGREMARAETARMLRVLRVARKRKLAPGSEPAPDGGIA